MTLSQVSTVVSRFECDDVEHVGETIIASFT